jgi:uncharacterized protein (DUF1800 family)
MVTLIFASLAACGGGGAAGSSVATSAAADSSTQAPAAQAVDPVAVEADAVRLAKQATFGPTMEVVDRIVSIGTRAWIEEQFAATGSSYRDIIAAALPPGSCASDDFVCRRAQLYRQPVAMRFYSDALYQPDQLRQRVALAFSQIMVASEITNAVTPAIAAYNQIFIDNAFGNYRDILMAVTMSGYMGHYLNMADSGSSAPSENYAREMLQLFSIGADRLNIDGTPVLDGTGAPVPNYGPDDIRGLARAFTGWTYARYGSSPSGDDRDFTKPMIPVVAPWETYDNRAKTFLGVTVPAGATRTESVAAAVDAAYNNSSTPPFIAKMLIRQLVMANPSPAYVSRVAGAFVNNGVNVRGDMKALIRAILTDPEARAKASGESIGKVKEPILLLTSLARLIGMGGDGYALYARDTQLGQPVFRAPSVFNFYPPDYPLPLSSTLVSPASKLMSLPFIVARHNVVYDWTIGALSARSEFAASAGAGTTGASLDWSSWEALDVEAQIDRIDLLMFNRTLSMAQKAALRGAANAVANSVPVTQARARAQAMLYVAASSPLFQVDR